MRFKQFLEAQEQLNKPFTIKMPAQAAFEWIRDNCPQYAKGVAEDSAIYRGMNAKDPYEAQWGDTSTFKRTSANTQNYYTLIADSSEKWEHLPKRSKSFICSSSDVGAGSYGKLYIVFPADKTEIGVCPRNDIWNSFQGKLEDIQMRSLNRFNGFLDDLGKALDIGAPDEESAEALRADLRKMTLEKIRPLLSNPNKEDPNDDMMDPFGSEFKSNVRGLVNYMRDKEKKDMEELYEDVLDPEDAGIDLQLVSHFHQNHQYLREIWFSGKAVFIPTGWLLNNEHEFNKLFTAEFGEFK